MPIILKSSNATVLVHDQTFKKLSDFPFLSIDYLTTKFCFHLLPGFSLGGDNRYLTQKAALDIIYLNKERWLMIETTNDLMYNMQDHFIGTLHEVPNILQQQKHPPDA